MVELVNPYDTSRPVTVEKMFFDGVTAVAPAGAVLSILTLQEKDKLEVAVGEYNHKLKKKIEEIQETCGIQ